MFKCVGAGDQSEPAVLHSVGVSKDFSRHDQALYRHFSVSPPTGESVLVLFIYLLLKTFIIFKMLCLCLYVPVHNSDHVEVEYFESNGLPSELKSLKSLSVLLPSQEFSTYRKWKKVKMIKMYILSNRSIYVTHFNVTLKIIKIVYFFFFFLRNYTFLTHDVSAARSSFLRARFR